MFAAAHRLLKPGGELYFADVYADRRLTDAMRDDPVVYGECLGGALYWNDFLRLSRAAGFIDPRLVEDRPLAITDPELARRVGAQRLVARARRERRTQPARLLAGRERQAARRALDAVANRRESLGRDEFLAALHGLAFNLDRNALEVSHWRILADRRREDRMPRLAEALQAAWQRDLGIRVSIAQVEQKTWISNQQTLNYGISTAAWTADYPDPQTFLSLFSSNSAYNWTGWKNADYDALLTRAAATPDAAARLELFQDAEKVLLESAPVAPLYFGAQTYLIHPAVRGWEPSLLVFRRYQKVWLEP